MLNDLVSWLLYILWFTKTCHIADIISITKHHFFNPIFYLVIGFLKRSRASIVIFSKHLEGEIHVIFDLIYIWYSKSFVRPVFISWLSLNNLIRLLFIWTTWRCALFTEWIDCNNLGINTDTAQCSHCKQHFAAFCIT